MGWEPGFETPHTINFDNGVALIPSQNGERNGSRWCVEGSVTDVSIAQ